MSLEQVLAKLDQISTRLSALESKVGGGGASAGPAAAASPASSSSGASPALDAYEQLVEESLGRGGSKFLELSSKIGGDTSAIAALAINCVTQLGALIGEASRSKKPSADQLQVVIKPLADAMGAVSTLQSKSRDKNKNNVFGVGEGIGIFGWVAVEPTPAPFASEMVGAAKFYTNKLLQEFKGKDELQVNWTHAWVAFLDGLVPYIKKFHTTGLAWNPRGGDAKPASASSAAPAAAAPAAAAAPKPAPAAAAPPVKGAALFSELNKGGDITSGLKKVARSETNKDKKISGKVEEKETKVAAAKPAKPSRCELNGTKWTVEYQVNATQPVVVKATAKNQTVYIYKCENCVVIIEGAVNSIALDSCKKVGLVFDYCVATAEIMNCASVKVQVKEKVPAIAVDKTAGIQIFLPKTSLDTQLVTATSSEMNLVVPNPKGDDHDPVEIPIPEQFMSNYRDGKLVTEQVNHSGG